MGLDGTVTSVICSAQCMDRWVGLVGLYAEGDVGRVWGKAILQ